MALQMHNRRDMMAEACLKMSSVSTASIEKVMGVGKLAFDALGAQAGAKDKVIIWAPLSVYGWYDLLQTIALGVCFANVTVYIIGMDDKRVAQPLKAPRSQGAQIILAPETDVVSPSLVSPSLVIYPGRGIEHIMSKFAYGTCFITTKTEANGLGATIIGEVVAGCCIAKLISDDDAAGGSKQPKAIYPVGKKLPPLPIAKSKPDARGKLYLLPHGTIGKIESIGLDGDVDMHTLEMISDGTTVSYFPSVATVPVNLPAERRRGGGWLDDAVTMQYKLTVKMKEAVTDFAEYVEAARYSSAWIPKKMSDKEKKDLKRKLGGL
tara:strand:+ start:754 stop:1719 length:966 start_codon:yes stop_codon:yes gene_type:complete